MTGLEFLLLALPVIMAAAGTLAAYLHVRADKMERARADQPKG